MTPLSGSQRWKKSVTRICVGLLIAVILVTSILLAGYLALVYKPQNYHPAPLSAQRQREVEIYRDRKVQEIYNNVNEMAPFTITLDENPLNDLLVLAQDTSFLPNTSPEIFTHFCRPQIHLTSDTFQLMGLVNYQSTQTVITLTAQPRITPDNLLEITINPPQAGAVAIPRTILREILTNLAQRLAPLGPNGPKIQDALLIDSPIDREQVQTALLDIIEKNTFTVDPWFPLNDTKSALITDIKITEGQIHFTLMPLLQ